MVSFQYEEEKLIVLISIIKQKAKYGSINVKQKCVNVKRTVLTHILKHFINCVKL